MDKPPLFKWRHFTGEIIVCGVWWYLRYALSYRDGEELLRERGVAVDHTTVLRWVQRYAPELVKRCRPHLSATKDSYRVDETYIKIKKQWYYLYRAVDSTGQSIDFQLRARRDATPRVITVGKHAAYPSACETLLQEGQLPPSCTLRQCQYLNNVIEQDHRFIKRRVNPGPGVWLVLYCSADPPGL